MRSRTLALAALLAVPPAAGADELPALTAQARSVEDLCDAARRLVKKTFSDDVTQEFERFLKSATDAKALPGLDPKRPLGLYSTLGDDVVETTGVLLVPVVGEKALPELLAGFGATSAPAGEKGLIRFTLPGLPVPGYARFHAGYAYLTVLNSDLLEAKKLIDPAKVIDPAEKAAFAARLRLDRLSDEFKLCLTDHLADLATLTAEPPKGEPRPGWVVAAAPLAKLALRWTEELLDGGREVTLRIDLDAGTREVVVEASADARPGSALAKSFAALGPTRNAFAGVGGKDAMVSLVAQLPLPAPELRDTMVRLIDAAAKDHPEPRATFGALFDAARRTARAGGFDLGTAVVGPDAKGMYTLAGAVSLKDTAALEKAFRDDLARLPEFVRKVVRLDADKAGPVAVHQLVVGGVFAPPEPLGQLCGNGPAYFAFAPDAVIVGYGPDALARLKAALAVKPGDAPILQFRYSAKKVLESQAKDNPALAKELARTLAADVDVVTPVRVTVTGGGRLTVRASFDPAAVFVLTPAVQRNPGPKGR